MRTLAALLALTVATTAGAARRGKVTPTSRLSLVQAQCGTVPPAPCSPSFAFASGTATLTGETAPQAACHPPARPKGGQVRLTRVTKNGAPFSGMLHVSVTLKTTFGTDTHNGNCELQGVQITTESLTGEIACRSGKCKGDLFGILCLPGTCADESFTTEFVSLLVNDDAGLPLAAPGIFVPAGKDDEQ